jgi:hypothetical protein
MPSAKRFALPVSNGVNALPNNYLTKECKMATSTFAFTVNGKQIEVRYYEGGWSFGDEHQKNKASLKNFFEIRGFLNGTAYLMDDTYPICVPGFHSKVSFVNLFTKWDEKDVAYVNFSRLNDEGIAAALASFGIKPQDGADAWLVLKAYHGRLLPQWKVQPLTKDELVLAINENKEKVEDPSVFAIENNKHAWNQLFLHNGMELAMMVVAGTIRVVAFPELDKNITTGFDVLQTKINNLLGERDSRQEALKQNAIAAKEQFRVQASGYVFTKYPGTIPAGVVSDEISVVVGGEFVNVSMASLVKARVSYRNGEIVQPTQIFLSSIGQVMGAIAQAAQRGAVLEVRKFAE